MAVIARRCEHTKQMASSGRATFILEMKNQFVATLSLLVESAVARMRVRNNIIGFVRRSAMCVFGLSHGPSMMQVESKHNGDRYTGRTITIAGRPGRGNRAQFDHWARARATR